MTKFTKGQAVYIPSCKQCGIIILDDAHNRPEIQRMDGESVWYNYDMLRSLHETHGYYVPEVGDVKPKGYKHKKRCSREWINGREIGLYLHEVDASFQNEYRFPIPPEAIESEKWARLQESVKEINEAKPISVSVGDGLTEEEVKEVNDSMTKRSTWINWRPTSERPEVGEYVLIKDSKIPTYYNFLWHRGSYFLDSNIAWVPISEFNEPQFPDPTLDLVRKLRAVTESEAVAILKERGV